MPNRWLMLTQSPLIIFSVALVIVVSAYYASLSGPLVFDDQLNIAENPDVAIPDLSYRSLKTAFFSNNSGKLKRVLPALSFGVNYYFAGGFRNTFIFKVTNLVVHIINFALVFWLGFLLWPRLFGSTFSESRVNRVFWTAFAALIWALHPIQTTAVVYVVQRMTSMSAIFVLLGLCVFVMGRERVARKIPGGFFWMWVGVIGGTGLGLLCKENAALLPLYAGVIEWVLFNRQHDVDASGGAGEPSGDKGAVDEEVNSRRLTYFYVFTLGLPVLCGFIYVFLHPGMMGGYEGRPFTLYERLLTEARVLWFYLYMLFVPDITVMGLFHDDMLKSAGLFTPWTTFYSVAAWVLVFFLAFLLRRKQPAFSFAVLWYLAGHSMESTVIPLKLIFEHRNYLPLFGPIVCFVWLMRLTYAKTTGRMTRMPGVGVWRKARLWAPRTLLSLCSLGVIAGLYAATYQRAEYWRSENEFIASTAINHPMSPSSQYLYGEVLYKKMRNPVAAYPYYFRAAQLEPDEVGFLISVSMVTPVTVVKELDTQRISKLIDPKHIATMLKTRPVSAWGLRALDVASRCVKSKHPACQSHVDHVRGWLNAAIANRKIGMERKRYFVNRLFEIEMGYDLRAAALETIENARAKDKGYFRYQLMHADVLASMGRFDDSLSLLDRAEGQIAGKSEPYLKDLRKMRKAILEIIARLRT
ncbi:MAG: tetratricopeptide repeat protein [Gammaproteobacteria bacterium]